MEGGCERTKANSRNSQQWVRMGIRRAYGGECQHPPGVEAIRGECEFCSKSGRIATKHTIGPFVSCCRLALLLLNDCCLWPLGGAYAERCLSVELGKAPASHLFGRLFYLRFCAQVLRAPSILCFAHTAENFTNSGRLYAPVPVHLTCRRILYSSKPPPTLRF